MNKKQSILSFTFVVVLLRFIHTENNEGGLILVSKENEDEAVTIEEENESGEVFIPTNEWKEIKPGQAIPKGLHVRINLQTGTKEAKLMDDTPEENQINYLKELKDVAKEAAQTKKSKFKNIDQLKKEFEELNINVKTDYELMKEVVTRLKTGSTSNQEKLNMYNDLEYYLHQFDNAQDFVKMKGIEMILPEFNSTDKDLRAIAAFVLGSAMQSNPKVQIAALENGLLPILLRTIAFDDSHVVRGHSLYALSCFIRRFPLAQQKFLEHGGLAALAKLFDVKLIKPEDYKIQIKILTLLTDLLDEQLLSKNSQDDAYQDEKIRQYNKVQLELNMAEHGWCSYIPRPLIVLEHDGREKVVDAMIHFVAPCRKEFIKSQPLLQKLYEEYKQLSADEVPGDDIKSSENYFTNLKHMIHILLTELNEVKDEL